MALFRLVGFYFILLKMDARNFFELIELNWLRGDKNLKWVGLCPHTHVIWGRVGVENNIVFKDGIVFSTIF